MLWHSTDHGEIHHGDCLDVERMSGFVLASGNRSS